MRGWSTLLRVFTAVWDSGKNGVKTSLSQGITDDLQDRSGGDFCCCCFQDKSLRDHRSGCKAMEKEILWVKTTHLRSLAVKRRAREC